MADRHSDSELMERVRDTDDPSAFAELVCRWRPRLAGYFRSLLGDGAAVDDAVQDVLVQLWARRAAYRAQGRFGALVLRYAEHHWLNLRRREARRLTEPLAQAAEPTAPDVAGQVLHRETQRVLADATAALPAGQREVFRLVSEEQLPEQAVAERLQVPVGTVKSRLHAARRQLRAALKELDDV